METRNVFPPPELLDVHQWQTEHHRVYLDSVLLVLEPGNEASHHVDLEWWIEEMTVRIQPNWKIADTVERHMVTVTPLKTMEERYDEVRAIIGVPNNSHLPDLHRMSSMDLLFWNCKGAGNNRFKRTLKELVRTQHPDIMVLMETKVELSSMGMFFNRMGFTASTHINPISRSRGIWVLGNPAQANVRVTDINPQVITAMVSRHNYPDWLLSAVYASPNMAQQEVLWRHLESTAQNNQAPWLLASDFNDFSHQNEKRAFSDQNSSNATQNQRRSRQFVERINKCSLMDLGCVGPRLTWSNNRKGWTNTMVRLDRALCNSE
ncbi:hypothetical protein LOK49_LG11G02200 [Camellia lanceoleosa]|uniref:Uncharacterized protein n=1 Tax=Camellia lanceoleosa TaxID=1840588 RepID=A0ACC0FYC0_9ERIC|nr:hypothetical protein LOK49_LG11G02200 [Camellia lanceoleosa]